MRNFDAVLDRLDDYKQQRDPVKRQRNTRCHQVLTLVIWCAASFTLGWIGCFIWLLCQDGKGEVDL